MIQRAGRSSQEQLAGIQALIETMLDQDQVESLVDCALRFLAAELDYPLLWIARYDAERSTLSGLGGGVPQSNASVFSQRYPILPGDLFDQVLLTRTPIEVMNLQEENRVGKWQTIAQRFDIQGALLHPIQYHQIPLGVLLLGSSHWGRNPRIEESSQLAILTRTLGAALHQLSDKQTPAALPQPQSLSTTLHQVSMLTDGQDRLNEILKSTQQFIEPTFTGLYWLDSEQNVCYLKSSYLPGQESRVRRARPVKAQVPLAEISSFCHMLSTGQMVSVSECQGTVNTKVPLRLMQQTKSRSMLCAPIMGETELLGFLSVEGAEPRVWQKQEKEFVQGAAQLIGLSVVRPEGAVQVSSQTHALIGQFTQLMLESRDWPKTLNKVTEHLCRHLQTQRLVLLRHDDSTGRFRVEYQYQSPKLRPLLDSLHPLSDVDMRMLERNIGAIAITDLEEDLRFLAWRESLINQGMRSLLVCRTVADRTQPHTILLLGNQRVRTWKPNDIEFLQQFAQALGTFEQKQRDNLQQQHQLQRYSLAQTGLKTILKIDDPTHLITTGIEIIAEIFNSPLAAGILWVPGQDQGQIVAYQSTPPEFAISDDAPIQLSKDPLLQQLLSQKLHPDNQSETVLKLSAADLAPETRIWLNSPGLGQVLVLALRSLDSPTPLGAIVIGTSPDHSYQAFDVQLLQTLVQHLASRYRTLRETHLLHRKWTNLECLNWYKQQSLESDWENLQTTYQKLRAFIPESASIPGRHLDTLEQTIQSLESLLTEEDWQLNLNRDSIPLASILKRSMERIEPLLQSKQLWTQIHNLTTNTTLTGASQKLELVLYELLLAACQRSTSGDRIDIWCRLVNSKWIELSITDQGQLHSKFIQDFHTLKSRDLLAPNLLDKMPGQSLKICHGLVERLGGRMELTSLEDGRILSRLTLPLS